MKLFILCLQALRTERYLVLAGNTNRSQLKSARLRSCLHARLVTKVDTRSGPYSDRNWLNSAGLLTVAGCALPSRRMQPIFCPTLFLQAGRLINSIDASLIVFPKSKHSIGTQL